MQVKKRTGKVEHADGAHDDQVFSYLMALYVLYMGNDLMERWGIQRAVVKTDEDKEIEESLIESEDAVERIDPKVFQEDKEIVTDEDRIEDEFWKSNENIKSEKDFQNDLKAAEDEAFNLLLSTDKGTADAYKKKYNSLPLEITSNNGLTTLNDAIFMGANGFYEDEEARREARRKHNGNLYDMFMGL